jgi:hypothetical protein
VAVSQTRALWIGVVVALMAAWILNLVRREQGVRFGRKFLLSAFAALVVLAVALLAISSIGVIAVEDVAERTASETGNYLMDPSILSRLLAWNAVLGEVRGAGVFLGNGFGATLTYFNLDFGMSRTVFWVDGSFFQTYLDMGLLGVFALLLLYASAIVRSAGLFLRTGSRERAARALGIFCVMTAVLVASLGHSLTVSYRYTVLWAVLMAMLQNEILREQTEAAGGGTVPQTRG